MFPLRISNNAYHRGQSVAEVGYCPCQAIYPRARPLQSRLERVSAEHTVGDAELAPEGHYIVVYPSGSATHEGRPGEAPREARIRRTR